MFGLKITLWNKEFEFTLFKNKKKLTALGNSRQYGFFDSANNDDQVHILNSGVTPEHKHGIAESLKEKGKVVVYREANYGPWKTLD